MRLMSFVAMIFVLGSLPVVAEADEHELAGVELEQVLDGVARREGLTFAVSGEVRAHVVVGQLDPGEITFAQLHTVLANNELAAVAVEDIVNIVPIATIRQNPLPILRAPDDSIPDDQWVTFIYKVERATATQMVPIMRPILPQQGHLVAHPDSNTVVLVDRYANALRVVELMRELDENSTAQEP